MPEGEVERQVPSQDKSGPKLRAQAKGPHLYDFVMHLLGHNFSEWLSASIILESRQAESNDRIDA